MKQESQLDEGILHPTAMDLISGMSTVDRPASKLLD